MHWSSLSQLKSGQFSRINAPLTVASLWLISRVLIKLNADRFCLCSHHGFFWRHEPWEVCSSAIARVPLSLGRFGPSFSHFFFSFIFISWRLITLQYCSGFCHTLTWISHGFTCVLHPDPASLPIPSLRVIPVHQPWALVSCIQPGLVICFTLDNIHVSMLFSRNIPP